MMRKAVSGWKKLLIKFRNDTVKKLIVIPFISMFSVGCASFEVPDNLPWDDCVHHDHHPGVVSAEYDHHHYVHHRVEGDTPFMQGLKERLRQKRVDRDFKQKMWRERFDNQMYHCGLTGDC